MRRLRVVSSLASPFVTTTAAGFAHLSAARTSVHPPADFTIASQLLSSIFYIWSILISRRHLHSPLTAAIKSNFKRPLLPPSSSSSSSFNHTASIFRRSLLLFLLLPLTLVTGDNSYSSGSSLSYNASTIFAICILVPLTLIGAICFLSAVKTFRRYYGALGTRFESRSTDVGGGGTSIKERSQLIELPPVSTSPKAAAAASNPSTPSQMVISPHHESPPPSWPEQSPSAFLAPSGSPVSSQGQGAPLSQLYLPAAQQVPSSIQQIPQAQLSLLSSLHVPRNSNSSNANGSNSSHSVNSLNSKLSLNRRPSFADVNRRPSFDARRRPSTSAQRVCIRGVMVVGLNPSATNELNSTPTANGSPNPQQQQQSQQQPTAEEEFNNQLQLDVSEGGLDGDDDLPSPVNHTHRSTNVNEAPGIAVSPRSGTGPIRTLRERNQPAVSLRKKLGLVLRGACMLATCLTTLGAIDVLILALLPVQPELNDDGSIYGRGHLTSSSLSLTCTGLSKLSGIFYVLNKFSVYVFFFVKQRLVHIRPSRRLLPGETAPGDHLGIIEKLALLGTVGVPIFAGVGAYFMQGDSNTLDQTCQIYVPLSLYIAVIGADFTLSLMYLYLFLQPLREIVRMNEQARSKYSLAGPISHDNSASGSHLQLVGGQTTASGQVSNGGSGMGNHSNNSNGIIGGSTGPKLTSHSSSAAAMFNGPLERIMRTNALTCCTSITSTIVAMIFMITAHVTETPVMMKLQTCIGQCDLTLSCIMLVVLMRRSSERTRSREAARAGRLLHSHGLSRNIMPQPRRGSFGFGLSSPSGNGATTSGLVTAGSPDSPPRNVSGGIQQTGSRLHRLGSSGSSPNQSRRNSVVSISGVQTNSMNTTSSLVSSSPSPLPSATASSTGTSHPVLLSTRLSESSVLATGAHLARALERRATLKRPRMLAGITTVGLPSALMNNGPNGGAPNGSPSPSPPMLNQDPSPPLTAGRPSSPASAVVFRNNNSTSGGGGSFTQNSSPPRTPLDGRPSSRGSMREGAGSPHRLSSNPQSSPPRVERRSSLGFGLLNGASGSRSSSPQFLANNGGSPPSRPHLPVTSSSPSAMTTINSPPVAFTRQTSTPTIGSPGLGLRRGSSTGSDGGWSTANTSQHPRFPSGTSGGLLVTALANSGGGGSIPSSSPKLTDFKVETSKKFAFPSLLDLPMYGSPSPSPTGGQDGALPPNSRGGSPHPLSPLVLDDQTATTAAWQHEVEFAGLGIGIMNATAASVSPPQPSPTSSSSSSNGDRLSPPQNGAQDLPPPVVSRLSGSINQLSTATTTASPGSSPQQHPQQRERATSSSLLLQPRFSSSSTNSTSFVSTSSPVSSPLRNVSDFRLQMMNKSGVGTNGHTLPSIMQTAGGATNSLSPPPSTMPTSIRRNKHLVVHVNGSRPSSFSTNAGGVSGDDSTPKLSLFELEQPPEHDQLISPSNRLNNSTTIPGMTPFGLDLEPSPTSAAAAVETSNSSASPPASTATSPSSHPDAGHAVSGGSVVKDRSLLNIHLDPLQETLPSLSLKIAAASPPIET